MSAEGAQCLQHPAPGLRWMSTDRPACGSCAASGPPHLEWPLFLPQFVPLPEYPVHLDSMLPPPLPTALLRGLSQGLGLGLRKGSKWARPGVRGGGPTRSPHASRPAVRQREAAGGQAGLAGPPCSSISRRTTSLPLPLPRPHLPLVLPQGGTEELDEGSQCTPLTAPLEGIHSPLGSSCLTQGVTAGEEPPLASMYPKPGANLPSWAAPSQEITSGFCPVYPRGSWLCASGDAALLLSFSPRLSPLLCLRCLHPRTPQPCV